MTGDSFPLASLLPIFAYFMIGLVFRKRGIATGEHAGFLFRLVFLVTLPALVFVSVSQADLSHDTALLPVSGFLVNLVTASCAAILCRVRGLSAAQSGAVVVSVGIMNMGFTFPFILATLGQGALAEAILFDVGNAVFVAFVAFPIAEYYGHGKARFSRASVRRAILSPILIAVVAGLVVNLASLATPAVLQATLKPLGAATIPLMLIAVGMSFGGFASDVREAAFTVTIRMLFGGLFGLACVWTFGFSGLTAAVVVVSAAAPIGASAAAMATVAGLNREIAVNAVSISALIGLLSTALLLFLASRAFV